MLRGDEFRVGDLATESGEGLTLLLPRAEYERAALIGEAFHQRYGVVLDGDRPGQAYAVGDDEAWREILVPGVTLEVNEKSTFDPAAPKAPTVPGRAASARESKARGVWRTRWTICARR